MPLQIKTKPGKATAVVTKEMKDGGKMLAEESVAESPPIAPTGPKEAGVPWCQVGFEASYTHNLGNFQSMRVGVSLTIPCQHHEIDAVYGVAEKWVNDRMSKLIEDITA